MRYSDTISFFDESHLMGAIKYLATEDLHNVPNYVPHIALYHIGLYLDAPVIISLALVRLTTFTAVKIFYGKPSTVNIPQAHKQYAQDLLAYQTLLLLLHLQLLSCGRNKHALRSLVRHYLHAGNIFDTETSYNPNHPHPPGLTPK